MTLIAEYRVVTRLGVGGMGEVFLVAHPRLPRLDALKLLDRGPSRNDEFRRRFEREADLLAPLRHPNIITLYDRGEFEGRLWLTMEYVAGTDVCKLLKSGPLALALAQEIVSGVGAALDYAYREHDITHRDVKPANILVEFSPDHQLRTVKLADFGIAKAAGATTSLTSTGVTVGTMSYIAPEAIAGRDIDNRADIYSLGCTAFEMLTGSLPFTAKTTAALLAAHLHQPVPSATERNTALPPFLDGVLARALAKNPSERYPDCAEFTAALQGPPAATRPAAIPAAGIPQPPDTASPDAARLPVTVPMSVTATPADIQQPRHTLRPRPKSRRWIIVAATSATLLAVVAGLVVGRSVVGHNYYVGEHLGVVAIMRGVPSSLLGYHLHEPYQLACLNGRGELLMVPFGQEPNRFCSFVGVGDLDPGTRAKVIAGLPGGSLSQAVAQVRDLIKTSQIDECPPGAATRPDSTYAPCRPAA